MIGFLVVTALLGVGGFLIFRNRNVALSDNQAWAMAAAAEESALGRMYMGAARLFQGTELINRARLDPQLSFLSRKLAQSGGLYGGSLDVFLAVQLAAVVMAVATTFVISLTGALPLWMGIGFALVMIAWPYARLSEAVKKRTKAILETLPTFVDLLIIPIVAGVGIRLSLEQTAKRVEGPVGAEVLRAAKDAALGVPLFEALHGVAERIAVPEAKTFFNSLAQAESSGTPILEQLEQYRDALRHDLYQHKRAMIRQLPIKLTILFVLHFLPLLFALIFAVVITQLTGVLAS